MDQTADQVVQTLVTLATTLGLQVAGAIAVLVIGRFCCGIARKAVVRGMEARKVETTLVPFVSNIVYYENLRIFKYFSFAIFLFHNI